MRFQKADPKAKTKWRFSRLIALFLAVLPAAAVILLISSAVAEEAWEPAGTLGIIAAAVLVAAQLLQIILYPVIQYAQWQYLIAPDRIEIRQGIFFRTHTVIPIARVQYASVTQSALQKPFDLANVQIHTAGDVMEIQELSDDMAERICAYLQKRVSEKLGTGSVSSGIRREG